MDAKAFPNPDLDATLGELAALGMRAARVVTRVMEIEQTIVDGVAAWLPQPGHIPASLSEAQAAGLEVDAAAAAMARTVPRIEILARALDRLSRSVRHSIALMRRMQAGWPRAGSYDRADDHIAMVRRQVARSVAEVIRREAQGEAAERLFDDLAERLDDPAFADELLVLPPEEVVRRVCRELGLVTAQLQAMHPEPHPSDERRPADTG
jgi:hypothetical protein